MKISLVTTTFNSADTISMCLDSVNNQTYPDIEHIIVDGASSDNTVDLINSCHGKIRRLISEPDRGMYNAMNKGISMATGDIVGVLNSDDFFADSMIVEKIAAAFQEENIDALYGDVRFVDPSDTKKVVRYYSSKRFTPEKFKYGFMPAHPSFYVKRKFFNDFGYYKEDYKIAADFELVIRFLYTYKLKTKYLEIPFVTMRTGGASTKSLLSNFIINKEIIRACSENDIKTNYLRIYSKYLIKVFELFSRGK